MTYVKTYLPTLKTHVVNLKRDAKDLSRDLQRFEVRGKLGCKTLKSDFILTVSGCKFTPFPSCGSVLVLACRTDVFVRLFVASEVKREATEEC